MDNEQKIRLRGKEEKDWRYALTVSRSGVIMSSTTDPKRGATFSDAVVSAVSSEKSKSNGIYKKTEVEIF